MANEVSSLVTSQSISDPQLLLLTRYLIAPYTGGHGVREMSGATEDLQGVFSM